MGDRVVGIRTAATVVLLSVAFLARAEDTPRYRVIVNRDSRVLGIDRKELSALFLGRRSQWPDGTPALPVDLVEDSRVREAFSRDVHGRRTATVKTYWLQVVFSGRGSPPIEKPNDRAVIAYVKSREGAVGYVSASARTDEVRVLRVDP